MSDELKDNLYSTHHSLLITHHSSLITSLTELSMAERIVSKRELLLVEVERWCGDPLCGARTRLSSCCRRTSGIGCIVELRTGARVPYPIPALGHEPGGDTGPGLAARRPHRLNARIEMFFASG